MSRNNRRRDKSSYAHEVPLEDSNGFHMTHIGVREARLGVTEGTYRGFYAPYRIGTPANQRELVKVQLTSFVVVSLKVPVPITRGEADAAVGLHGESRTMGMTEYQKQLRVARIREEHNRIVPHDDHIERARAKMAFYPVVGDERNAATVGPRVDIAALLQFANV